MESPQMVLPFAEREYVDVPRCGRILGVSWTTVYRLAATRGFDDKPLLQMVEYRRHARKRILYASIVRYCDKLRSRYQIKDRRPVLASAMLRNRDEDLLPFPLADTIYTKEALAALGYETHTPLTKLIEEGAFEAYKLVAGKEWRISRSSFAAFLRDATSRPLSGVQPYKRVAQSREAEANSPILSGS